MFPPINGAAKSPTVEPTRGIFARLGQWLQTTFSDPSVLFTLDAMSGSHMPPTTAAALIRDHQAMQQARALAQPATRVAAAPATPAPPPQPAETAETADTSDSEGWTWEEFQGLAGVFSSSIP